MVGIIEGLVIAAGTVFAWPNVLFLLLGTFIGLVFGALPGLGGVVALALVIPVTFGMNTETAMVFFAGTLGGVAFGGSVSAILINVPGTAPNAATCFDGHPMAVQGRAKEALGISAMASASGAVVGLVCLILLIPVARPVILAFSWPEFFWLAVFGLTAIAVTSQGSLLKGLISGGIGLLFSFVGHSAMSGEVRFGLGTNYLWDGVQLIPAIIGLFAISEVIKLAVQEGTIAKSPTDVKKGSIWKGVKTVIQNPSLFVRSAVIGMLSGLIPGVGGTVANFIAYLQAVQTSGSNESFGNGNPKGVLASEASNDAATGGALLPTVVFGIPGSATTAVLLGGFILHGIQPGSELLGPNLPVLLTLIVALIAANILTSLAGVSFAGLLSKITMIDVKALIPVITAVSLVGAYTINSNFGDVVMAMLFGFLGYFLIIYQYSRIAVVIALILGPIAEQAFFLSLRTSDIGLWILFVRPISALLIILTIASLSLPFVRALIKARRA